MRKYGKRDSNHREIVQALRALHWKVADTADVGGGFPDVVGSRGHEVRLFEIKTPKGKLTAEQQRFMIRDGWPVTILRSVEDVERL